jgi:hypothetical protein
MSKWSPWDWIAYTCLGIAAGGAAISALPKETRAVFEGWSSLFTSPKWSFVPAIFFIIATSRGLA